MALAQLPGEPSRNSFKENYNIRKTPAPLVAELRPQQPGAQRAQRQGTSGRSTSSSSSIKMTSFSDLSKTATSAKQEYESLGPTGKTAQGPCGVGWGARHGEESKYFKSRHGPEALNSPRLSLLIFQNGNDLNTDCIALFGN